METKIFLLVVLIVFIILARLTQVFLTVLTKNNFLFSSKYCTKKIFFLALIFKILAALKIGGESLMRVFVDLNNKLVEVVYNKKHMERILILLPRCLQNQACAQAVVDTVKNCKLCGKCDLALLNKINYTDSTKVIVAAGSRIAVEAVSNFGPEFIIAVACEKELFLGLLEINDVPIYAVYNSRPEGPCKNTKVEVELIQKVLSEVC